jgi:hypothetical protein
MAPTTSISTVSFEPARLAAIAKGDKTREIRLPLRLLRRVTDYVELERANAVAVFAARMAGSELKMAVTTLGADRHSALIDDGNGPQRVRLDLLSPKSRSCLICRTDNGGPEPALLWLTETGLPVTAATWESIFRRASLRCRDHGIDIEVSPHSLRHYLPRRTMSRSVTGLCDSCRKLQVSRMGVRPSTRHSFPRRHSCKPAGAPRDRRPRQNFQRSFSAISTRDPSKSSNDLNP